jgi:Arc/MetJ-type ribon-helix-helix transcriptional regulator
VNKRYAFDLPPEDLEFIRQEVSARRYRSPDKVITAGLRMLKKQRQSPSSPVDQPPRG